MPLETVNYISDLVATNPAQSDQVAEGDNHIRNIKLALLNTFPNVDGATDVTHTQLTYLGEKSFQPGDVKMRATASYDATHWHECFGQLVNVATDAALYAAIGTSYNTGGETAGVTFRVPNFDNRYPRGRSAVNGYVLGYLSQAIESHSHTASASSSSSSSASTSVTVNASGTLSMSGSTGDSDRSLDHTHGYTAPNAPSTMFHGTIGGTHVGGTTGSSTGTASNGYGSHLHSVSVSGANHGHSASASTSVSTSTTTTVTVNAAGGSETRPNTCIVSFLIKR